MLPADNDDDVDGVDADNVPASISAAVAVAIMVFSLFVLVGILLLLLLLLLFLLPLPANHRCCHFRFRLTAMRLIVLTWSKWLKFLLVTVTITVLCLLLFSLRRRRMCFGRRCDAMLLYTYVHTYAKQKTAVTLQFVSHNFLDYHDPTIGK